MIFGLNIVISLTTAAKTKIRKSIFTKNFIEVYYFEMWMIPEIQKFIPKHGITEP